MSIIERLSMMCLRRALKEGRPQYNERHDKVVILQHDNAGPPHVVNMCSLSFSPHSPRSMTNGLADEHFSSYEEVKNWIHRPMDLIDI
nr:Mariner Mos1 transposase [Hymenolepis microstoma]